MIRLSRLQGIGKLLPTAPGEWLDEAACSDVHPEIFFPEDLPSRNFADKVYQQQVINAALSVCGRCPVREQCLAYGIDEDFGIWGGTLPAHRQKLRNYNNRKDLS